MCVRVCWQRLKASSRLSIGSDMHSGPFQYHVAQVCTTPPHPLLLASLTHTRALSQHHSNTHFLYASAHRVSYNFGLILSHTLSLSLPLPISPLSVYFPSLFLTFSPSRSHLSLPHTFPLTLLLSLLLSLYHSPSYLTHPPLSHTFFSLSPIHSPTHSSTPFPFSLTLHSLHILPSTNFPSPLPLTPLSPWHTCACVCACVCGKWVDS